MSSNERDFIIVGGGASGLIVAARLTEDPNISVLVLEAGEERSTDPRITTPALWPSLLGTDVDWGYLSEPQASLNGKRIPLSQGRILGGSSAINGQAFVANSKFSIDQWATLGNTGWDWKELAPYFQKSCTFTKPSQSACNHMGLDYVDEKNSQLFHGPIQASFPDESHGPIPNAWIETWKQMGHPITSDPFTGEAIGGYINAMNIDPITKQRSHVANAYYNPIKTRTNLHVITSALVQKLVLGKISGEIVATGVEYTKDGNLQSATARKEVILAAGVFNTPKILELSGIGSPSLLESFDIPIIIPNENVGENLQDHPNAGFSFEVADGVKTLDDLARQDPVAIGAAMEAYAKHQNGPFASGGNFAGGLLPLVDFLSPSEQGKNSQFGKETISRLLESSEDDGKPFTKHHKLFVESLLSTPTEASGLYLSWPAQSNFVPEAGSDSILQSNKPGSFLTICAMLLHPLSRGSSHIVSTSPDEKVSIDLKYLSNPLDLEVFARHVRYISKMVSSQPLRKLLKENGRRNNGFPTNVDDLDEIKQYVKKAALSSWHPTSTCAMLPADKGGVVSEKLIIYGTKNLRIVDASVIPLATRGNCQTTVYAVAEKAADIIKKEHSLSV